MALTLLQLVQETCDELGLQRPATVVNSVDPQVRQLYALMNREGRELQQDVEWTALQNYFIINVAVPVTTTGDITQNSAILINIPDTSGIAAERFVCTGPGIPVGARVVSVDSATQVTLDSRATGTTVGGALVFAQDTYSKPDDFDRFINQTWWDRTNRWALMGPDSPQIDQWHRSGVVTTGPRRHFRLVGIDPYNYRIWPPPTASDSPIEFVTEYISKNWVLAANGTTTLPYFQNDTDTSILDENMIVLGCKWRFWQIKGFDYAAMQREALDYASRKRAEDGGARVLNLARTPTPFLLSPAQIPDGFWAGPTGPNDT